MKLLERFYQYKGSEIIEYKESITLSEYKTFLLSTFKDVYNIQFVQTSEELIVLFFYDNTLSHVTTYKLSQFI